MTNDGAKQRGRVRMHGAPRLGWWSLGMMVLLMAGPLSAVAQPTVGQGVAVYRFAEPGQPVIAVDLWGTVRSTGRFFVREETTLVDLLTLAGGPLLQAETEQAVREVTVEVSRMQGSARAVVYASVLEDLTSGVEAAPPPLLDGDVVTVRTSIDQTFSWIDAISVVAAVASVTLVILRIADLSGGI
ncbi:MAG: hypothetical protein R3181_05670 [Rubricoccaceae bacterium]|nr:hypothetical protein [Rubricoccaceae bacterium]